ncbi:MAG TPA: GNAT family protein [Segetibacter sp.]
MSTVDFTLRPWTMNDLGSLVSFANNYQIAKNMSDQFPHPYTIEKGKAFIEHATKSSPVNIFAIDVNNQAVGGIGIHPQGDVYNKNAELGYWLAEQYWGNGIVSKAIIKMIDYGFSTFDIYRIYARPFGTNIASQKVLEKAGFKLEARYEKTFFKNGEFHDELVYAVRRGVNSI